MFILTTLLTISLGLIVGLGISGITRDIGGKWIWWPIPLMFFLFFMVGTTWTYVSNSGNIFDLKNKSIINIQNEAYLLRNLHAKVLIKEEGKNLLINVANMEQSKKSTEAWMSLNNTISFHNRLVSKFLFYQENPFLGFFRVGPCPSNVSELKFIRLKNVDDDKWEE